MRMSARATLETVDIETRDKLVMEHVGLVKALASRLAHRIPAQVELSELISVGVLGLIDAAGRYRPSLGVPFDAFARRRIHGAMLDALRELDWAPRYVRAKTTLQSLGMSTARAYFNSVCALRNDERERLYTPAFKRALQDYRAEQLLQFVRLFFLGDSRRRRHEHQGGDERQAFLQREAA